ncbi:hypothetical protein OA344_01945 [Pseudomonadota bacterium]|nr:hypothetical protein [Pseudomonadota bacterium]
MATSLQITLALIGVVVVLGVCIPVLLKKSKTDGNELNHHHPSENSIKNFDIDINLHSENDSSQLNQLDLPIQEENNHQLNLFDEITSDRVVESNDSQEINQKEVVYKLFIKPRFDSAFSGLKVRLPVFCKKIMVGENNFIFNVADMYEPGVIDLKTIDKSHFKGLVIFVTMEAPRNRELLATFFDFSFEIGNLLQGELFLDEYIFTERNFSTYELILQED